jgi:hypothetical protein
MLGGLDHRYVEVELSWNTGSNAALSANPHQGRRQLKRSKSLAVRQCGLLRARFCINRLRKFPLPGGSSTLC